MLRAREVGQDRQEGIIAPRAEKVQRQFCAFVMPQGLESFTRERCWLSSMGLSSAACRRANSAHAHPTWGGSLNHASRSACLRAGATPPQRIRSFHTALPSGKRQTRPRTHNTDAVTPAFRLWGGELLGQSLLYGITGGETWGRDGWTLSTKSPTLSFLQQWGWEPALWAAHASAPSHSSMCLALLCACFLMWEEATLSYQIYLRMTLKPTVAARGAQGGSVYPARPSHSAWLGTSIPLAPAFSPAQRWTS